MNNDKNVPSPNEKQIEIWKLCWDFLGGAKSWEEAVKRWKK